MWWTIEETRTVARQLAPPSIERNERIAVAFAFAIGTITCPFGWTTGWPPTPPAWSPVVSPGAQLSPPSSEVLILIRLPLPLSSHSV